MARDNSQQLLTISNPGSSAPLGLVNSGRGALVDPLSEVSKFLKSSSFPSSFQANPNITVGSNVDISQRLGYQGEPVIAINPTNPSDIVVTSNNETGTNLFEAYSLDGGTTWKTQIIANNDALGNACCDPGLSFDNYGNLFLSYINRDSPGGNISGVGIALSTNGGISFSPLTTIADSGADYPSIRAAANSVWVSYQAGNGIAATGASVTGLGKVGSFIAPELVPGSSGDTNFGDIAIGPNGQIMVTYQDNTGSSTGPSNIRVNIDPDGLGSSGFGNQIKVTTSNVGGFEPIPAQPNRTIFPEARLAWDLSGGSHNGRVYLSYTDAPAPGDTNTDIFLRYSDNNGSTWSNPVRVNDDSTTNSQFFPRIAVDRTTGNIALAWYDARNDTGKGAPGDTNGIPNDDTQLYAAVSTDGGVTFGSNVRVSIGTSNAADSGDLNDYGDYMGIDFYGGKFYPVWADNSNSTGNNPDGTLNNFDLYTAQVTVSGSVVNFPQINFPQINFPQINFPQINFPQINFPSS